MNMRKRKQAIKLAMYYIAHEGKTRRWIEKLLTPTPEEAAKLKEQNDKLWGEIMASLEEPLVEYDPKNFVHMT